MKKSLTRKKLIALAIAGAIGTGSFVAPRMFTQEAIAQEVRQTLQLTPTDLSRVVSVSGTVHSANVYRVFSTQTRPVAEVFVQVGDSVQAGDVLARLDVSNVENELKTTQLNHTEAQSRQRETQRSNANAVTNAQLEVERQSLSLENARQDLERAIANLAVGEVVQPTGTTTNNVNATNARQRERAVIDAGAQLERRQRELNIAQENYDRGFDAHSQTTAIQDAEFNLERRTVAFEHAQERLTHYTNERPKRFDATTYNREIRDAEERLNRAIQDQWTHEENWAVGQRNIDDARTAIDRARNNLNRARDTHEETETTRLERALETAERTYTDTRNALADAHVQLERAQAGLTRGEINSNETLTRELQTARINLDEAQRLYTLAQNDQLVGHSDDQETLERALQTAQRAYDAANNQLINAQTLLQQAQTRPNAETNTIALREADLDRLQAQLGDAFIIATGDGVVTELNAQVGSAPSGVLFVIEDMDELYVRARVREHSLGELAVGQNAEIFTDARRDVRYGSEVTFISPRAVSAAGNTNVEFMIHATINEPTEARIGMNAFVNITTQKVEGIFAVPLSAVEATDHGDFVYAMIGETLTAIPVETGLRTNTHVEISGDNLHAGLNIVID